MQTTVTLPFADGEYDFRLGLAQIHELERKCDAGISEIFARVMAGTLQDDGGEFILSPMQAKFYASDVIEAIRQGLIGGNRGEVDGEQIKVSPGKAQQLLKGYVEDRPLMESWELACAILGSCVIGYEAPGKKAEAAASETPQESSDSITD